MVLDRGAFAGAQKAGKRRAESIQAAYAALVLRGPGQIPWTAMLASTPPAHALVHARYRMARVGEVIVLQWLADPRPEDFTAITRTVRTFANGMPDKLELLILVPADGGPPASGVREEMVRVAPELYRSVRRFSLVIAGNSFRQTLIRGVFTGVRIVLRTRAPLDVYRSCEDAVRHLLHERDMGVDEWMRLARHTGVLLEEESLAS